MPIVAKGVDPPCDSCLRWKITKPPKTSKKKNKIETPTKFMEKAQIDIAHMSVASWGGEFYFQVVIEEHTSKFALSFFKLKSQSLPEYLTGLMLLTMLKLFLMVNIQLPYQRECLAIKRGCWSSGRSHGIKMMHLLRLRPATLGVVVLTFMFSLLTSANLSLRWVCTLVTPMGRTKELSFVY